jgi:hypothetical protein
MHKPRLGKGHRLQATADPVGGLDDGDAEPRLREDDSRAQAVGAGPDNHGITTGVGHACTYAAIVSSRRARVRG